MLSSLYRYDLPRVYYETSQAGFSIITLKELGKSSASNSEVLYLAKTKEALLLTCDLDFSNILIYTLQALIAASSC